MTDRIAIAFEPARESLTTAEEAIVELSALTTNFFESHPPHVVEDFDPANEITVVSVLFDADIPHAFRRKASEALLSARHSFDQSLYAAQSIVRARAGRSVYFPWSKHPADLAHLLKSRAIEPVLHPAIFQCEPYYSGPEHEGGDDTIRRLASIANNKHTVGLSIGLNMPAIRYPRIHGSGDILLQSRPWNPRTKRAELLRYRGECRITGSFKFVFIMDLSDKVLPAPIPLIWSLEQFRQKARNAFDALKAACCS